MKSIIVGLIVFLSVAFILQESDRDAYSEFEIWKISYGKHYTETQEVYRFFNYQNNREKVKKHNSDPTQTYVMQLNQFSDLSHDEFVYLYLTAFSSGNANQEVQNNEQINTTEQNIRSVDWRKITQVKDQGACGGCWAFGAVGAAEGYFYVKQSKSVLLSEQQLIDCDLSSFGCNGGYQNLALKYIANYGLTTAQAYPYTQKQGTCKQTGGPYQTNGAQSVSSANFKTSLAEYPLVVLVDASNWQFYGGGVFSNCKKSVNHAVLAVGYDDSDNWFVKNSWGSSWGDKGFITLAPGNTCGVTGYAYRAI